MSSTFVIAECGSCHGNDLVHALELVEAVRESGADCAKFQFWSNADRLADRRKVPEHYREIYRRYQMPESWLPVLKEACDARSVWTRGLRPIELMVTCYLAEDIAVVAPFVDRFKVSSFEAEDETFLTAHRRFHKPVIVSCGMQDAKDVWSLADVCLELFADSSLLHCVSAYPVSDVAAMTLSVLRGESPFQGLSDHSRHPLMGALAVAAGAEIVEAHIRLEKTCASNPDYATALTPSEFAEYVRNIRFAEQVMGSGEKRLQECERPMAAYRVQPS